MGISWVLLGASWLPDAAQDALGLDFESILVPPRPSLEASWNVFPSIFSDASILYMSKFRHAFCEQTLDLYNALIAAENPCMVSPTIIFSPSGPAISAQYIRCLPQGCRACSVGCPCSASCRLLCPANCLCCQLLLPCQLPLPCQQSVFKGSFCFNGSWASIASSICVHRFGPWLPPAGAIDLHGQLGSNGSRVPTVPGVQW